MTTSLIVSLSAHRRRHFRCYFVRCSSPCSRQSKKPQPADMIRGKRLEQPADIVARGRSTSSRAVSQWGLTYDASSRCNRRRLVVSIHQPSVDETAAAPRRCHHHVVHRQVHFGVLGQHVRCRDGFREDAPQDLQPSKPLHLSDVREDAPQDLQPPHKTPPTPHTHTLHTPTLSTHS